MQAQVITARDLLMCLIAEPDERIKPFGLIPVPEIFKDLKKSDAACLRIRARRNAYLGQWLNLSLELDETGREERLEPFDDMSTMLRFETIDADAGEFIFPMYDTREYYRDDLIASGYFEDTGRRMTMDFGRFEVWRITDRFLSEFAAANRRAMNKALKST